MPRFHYLPIYILTWIAPIIPAINAPHNSPEGLTILSNFRDTNPELPGKFLQKPIDLDRASCEPPRSNETKTRPSSEQTGYMAQPNGNAQAIAEAAVAAAASKPKRVRTGCLTCRERHLKCDETFPGDCLNCRKSSRVCKRGIKLNFIDTTCKRPPVMPETEEWAVDFMDESRDIASEYAGGLQQYPIRDPKPPSHNPNDVAFDYNNVVPPRPVLAHQQIPRDQDVLHHGQMDGIQQNNQFDQSNMDTDPPQPLSSINSAYSQSALPTYHAPYERVADGTSADPSSEAKEILNTREETLFMQVFVEEVGLWMDSMDSMKHVCQIWLLALSNYQTNCRSFLGYCLFMPWANPCFSMRF